MRKRIYPGRQAGTDKEDIMAEIEKTGKAPGKTEIVWKDRKHRLWFPLSFTKYYIKNGRIYMDKGLLNTTSDQTLLYRITDIQMKRSLGQKIFGTGTVTLVSNVDANPKLHLQNIKHPHEVYDRISDLIEEARSQKNVIGKEFYSRGGQGFGPDHGPGPVPEPFEGVDLDGDGIPDDGPFDDGIS